MFRDTSYTQSTDLDDASSINTTTQHRHPEGAYPGPFVLSENEARREGQHHTGTQERSPKVIHPELDQNDPARRTSDQPLFGFANPKRNHNASSPGSPSDETMEGLGLGLGLGLAGFADFDEGHGNARWLNAPESVTGMTRDTAYETAPGTPMISGESELEDHDEESGIDAGTEDGASTLADKERATTKAAAAEVVSYSHKVPPTTMTTTSTSAAEAERRKSSHGEATVSPDSDLSSSGKKDGPWVFVSDVISPTSPANQQSPTTAAVAATAPILTSTAQPAAVPTAIPIPSDADQSAFVKHARKGSFPWSKSRREAREKEKVQERERKTSGKTAGSTSQVAAPKSTSTPVSSVPESTENQQFPSALEQTPSISSLVVETGAGSTAQSSSSSDSSSSDSSTTTTSSSSPFATPTVNNAALPSTSTSGNGEGSQNQTPTKEKGKGGSVAGMFGRRKNAIPEVGTADRRLTID